MNFDIGELQTATEAVKQMKKDQDTRLKKLEDAAALNQEALNDLIADKKHLRLGSGGGGVQSNIDLAISQNLDNLQKLSRGEIKSFRIDTKAVGDMGFSTNFPTASSSVATVHPVIIENASRPLHVRDLIPKGQMTGSNFVYMKEGTSEGGVTTVAEGATKPQIDFDLSEVTVPAQYLAGWLRISKKMLDDVQSMRAFLGSRLMEALLVVEDAQLLNGDGTGTNLKGINTAGNFTAATGAATVDIEQLIQGISQLAGLGRRPSGIVLHPSDYFALTTNKASTSGVYDLPGIVSITPEGVLRIAGVPVAWTVAQSQDTYTIGDFQNGSLLLFREAPVIEFFEQDSTNVRENKITIRIEERVAFAVFADTYFVKGDLGNIA